MKDWIMALIVELILKALADDKIEELAHTVQSFLIPFLEDQKNALITELVLKANATDTKLDDAAAHALDVFLSSFIPSQSACQALSKI